MTYTVGYTERVTGVLEAHGHVDHAKCRGRVSKCCPLNRGSEDTWKVGGSLETVFNVSYVFLHLTK